MAHSLNPNDPLEGTSKMHKSSEKMTSKTMDKFVHYFNYKLSEELLKKKIMENTNIYEEIVHITPANSYMLDNNILHIKLITNKAIIHTVEIMNKLRNAGFYLKLSPNQMDKNSVFCVQVPQTVAQTSKNDLIQNICEQNTDLIVLDTYVPPSKNENFTSIKITLLTQTMVSNVLNNGLKILDNFIDDCQISRAKILKTIQCSKCNDYGHGLNACKSQVKKCPHCTANHSLKECNNKNDKPICCNCGKDHRASSNRCEVRRKYIGVPTGKDDRKYNFVKNPESSHSTKIYYKPAPTPASNPWFKKPSRPLEWGDEYTDVYNGNNDSDDDLPNLLSQPSSPNNNLNFTTLKHSRKPIPRKVARAVTMDSDLSDNEAINDFDTTSLRNINQPQQINPQSSSSNNINKDKQNVIINEVNIPKPTISYHEVLLMSKHFSNWTFAFVELQKAFNMDVIQIPQSLSEMLIREEEFPPSSPSSNNSSNILKNLNNSANSSTSLDNTNEEAVHPEDQSEDEPEIPFITKASTPILSKSTPSTGAIPKKPPASKSQSQTNQKVTSHSLPIHKDAITNNNKPKNCSPAVTRSNSKPQQVNNNNK